jgi:hypothetical protein
MSIAGPKPIRSVAHGPPPDWIGFALISTPWSINSASKPGPRNAGSVVLKVVTDRDSLKGAVPEGGKITAVLKRPSIASPRLYTASTFPFPTSSLNKVYGTTGASGLGNKNLISR